MEVARKLAEAQMSESSGTEQGGGRPEEEEEEEEDSVVQNVREHLLCARAGLQGSRESQQGQS